MLSIENLIYRENPIFELSGVSTLALKTFKVFNTQYKMAAFDVDEDSVVEDDDVPE